jgi:esterase/lipase
MRCERADDGVRMIWIVGALVLAAVVLVLAVAVPTQAGDFRSFSKPARSYAEAIERVARQQEVDDQVVAPGGRTVLMTHGAQRARVVVLLHGLTNSPRQFEHLAARLFATGDNVFIPRLPHHAERNGTVASLAGLTAEELRCYADAAADVAVGLGHSVVVAGVSAGGTVGAWLAQWRSDIDCVVMIAPVLEIGRLPSCLATPLLNFALRLPNVNRGEAPDPDRPDRDLGVSSRAVAALLRLGASVRRAALQARPRAGHIIFVMNANDHTVKTLPAVELARAWSAHGAAVVMYQFPLSLALPHDIAEEARVHANPAVVYPALEALIHGEPPPPVLAGHLLWPT